uniref:DUF1127 domain-containing protein n=1 Tax=Yoonia sp. TaxID=2212373 RepID=UPI0040471C2C
MAFVTSRPIFAPFAGNLTHLIKSAAASFVAWNDTRNTRKSLSKLSARELDDIGLSFCDVEGIAKRVTR